MDGGPYIPSSEASRAEANALSEHDTAIPQPRIAVVHDWLYVLGGAEKVLAAILRCFPHADVFCLFDILSDKDRAAIGCRKVTTSFLQRWPLIRRNHRIYLPLMPLAIEQFDLTQYDIVISSSSAVAKGVITGPDQVHVTYVHSPMRYAWDLQHQYLAESRLRSGLKSWLARTLLHYTRLWDTRTANGVDRYVANSHFVGRRLRKLYGVSSTVVYPPVRVPATLPACTKQDFFLTASRLVPYKNVLRIVEAFALRPQERLVVVGDGPQFAQIKAIAGTNVEMLGRIDDAALHRLMGQARAFVFAAEEDFGIVPVEAQAMGTPVIALSRGGALETVIGGGEAPTGLFFASPDAPSIAAAIGRFLEDPARFTPHACHRNARRFASEQFDRVFPALVMEVHEAAQQARLAGHAPIEPAPRGPSTVAGTRLAVPPQLAPVEG